MSMKNPARKMENCGLLCVTKLTASAGRARRKESCDHGSSSRLLSVEPPVIQVEVESKSEKLKKCSRAMGSTTVYRGDIPLPKFVRLVGVALRKKQKTETLSVCLSPNYAILRYIITSDATFYFFRRRLKYRVQFHNFLNLPPRRVFLNMVRRLPITFLFFLLVPGLSTKSRPRTVSSS